MSPGTTSFAVSSTRRPSRIAFARGATSSASWSSVSFAFSSWRIPIAELTIAIRPKIASAHSPSERMRMKKTPMIALNSVRTLAVTMLATERLEVGSGSPRRASRRAASALDSPWVTAARFHGPIYTERAGDTIGSEESECELRPRRG